MLHYKQGFLGPYIAAVELPEGKVFTLRIAAVKIEKVESIKDDDEAGRKKDRLVVYFDGRPRGWLINRTNAECIVGMFGEDAHKWIGKRVSIYRTKVRFGSKMEDGIRVKGSPDLDRDIVVTVRLPRKKASTVTMVKTGASTASDLPPDAPPAEPVEDNATPTDGGAE